MSMCECIAQEIQGFSRTEKNPRTFKGLENTSSNSRVFKNFKDLEESGTFFFSKISSIC